jgi:hypothetical protein
MWNIFVNKDNLKIKILVVMLGLQREDRTWLFTKATSKSNDKYGIILVVYSNNKWKQHC